MYRWVLSLQRELEMLATQSAAIQSITVKVTGEGVGMREGRRERRFT